MEEYQHTTPVKANVGSSIAFLLLSFPLGLLYFLIVVIGLSVGVSTLILWIGLPIVFLTLILIQCLAEVERRVRGFRCRG